MRNLLSRAGVHCDGQVAQANIQQTVAIMTDLYFKCLEDHELSRAAYGCAVGGLSIALNCSLKTAALLFEHGLALRHLRGDQVPTLQVVERA